jgi:hypothetical protein
LNPHRDLDFVFGKGLKNYTPDGNGKRTKDAYDEFGVRRFIALASGDVL